MVVDVLTMDTTTWNDDRLSSAAQGVEYRAWTGMREDNVSPLVPRPNLLMGKVRRRKNHVIGLKRADAMLHNPFGVLQRLGAQLRSHQEPREWLLVGSHRNEDL